MNKKYFERDLQLGANIIWLNSKTVFSKTTHRGIHFEMVDKGPWGLCCYMNGVLQSSKFDEKIYHSALVDRPDGPIKGNVCILGGGEGATAREVLAKDGVQSVRMIDWDRDVVDIFRTLYPQWGQGAWKDERLTVEIADVKMCDLFENIYDGCIVDLFEPDDLDREEWNRLFAKIKRSLKPLGWLNMYAGMYDLFNNGRVQKILAQILEENGFRVVLQRIYIPSFLGEAAFLFALRIT